MKPLDFSIRALQAPTGEHLLELSFGDQFVIAMTPQSAADMMRLMHEALLRLSRDVQREMLETSIGEMLETIERAKKGPKS